MTDLFDYMTDQVEEEEAVTTLEILPQCGLCIMIPATEDHDRQCFLLGQALHAANRYTSYDINRHIVILDPAVGGKAASLEETRAYSAVVQKNGFVFLVVDDAELARESGADGVLCNSLKKCSDARKILDENRIIGLRASTRAAAQSALSLELDFVQFRSDPHHGEPLTALLDWWVMTTDVPVSVEGDFDQENCAPYISGGATFIDASSQIWGHPSGNPMQGSVNMLDAIERHAREHKVVVN